MQGFLKLWAVVLNPFEPCRARTRADFVSKMGVVEEECDESLYWMEVLIDAGIVKPVLLADLLKEGTEILSLIVASRKTARLRK
jgi:four helix bundle protein